ncbi:MAG: GIY-YIG nuclease family protein [Polynucleobacter sp.]
MSRKPLNYYKNIDHIVKELIKAGSWTKFRSKHGSAYRSALKYFSKKRIERAARVKPSLRRPAGYYKNINNIAKELKKAGSWLIFHKAHSSAYTAINSYFSYEDLEELTGIYRVPKNIPKIWTEEKIRAKAKEYKARHQFRQKASGAANAADRLGIFESVCEHMPIGQFGWLHGIYVVVSEAKKQAYVGLTRYPERREGDHLKHWDKDCRSKLVAKHEDAKFILLSECVLNGSDAKNAEIDAYNTYVQKGYEVVNEKSCLGGLGAGHEKHTQKNFKKRVDEFKGTIEDFYKATERSCIQKARDQGWLQYAYEHLPSRKVSFEEAKELAAQCKKVSEFVNKYPREADMARNRGWLPKITAHMENPTPSEGRASAKWGTEEKIWAEIYKYSIFRQFIKGSNGAYKAIRRFDGLSERVKEYFAGLKADPSIG